jgi:hypothetical protein
MAPLSAADITSWGEPRAAALNRLVTVRRDASLDTQ